MPAGWTQRPASAMRIASFIFKGSNGLNADISVIPLSGPAGGKLANINRWRSQLQLEPITEEDLLTHSEIIRPAGRKMTWVDFASKTPIIESKYKSRIVAAIYVRGQRSWFFKMMGEQNAVQEALPAFREFLGTLRFNDRQ